LAPTAVPYTTLFRSRRGLRHELALGASAAAGGVARDRNRAGERRRNAGTGKDRGDEQRRVGRALRGGRRRGPSARHRACLLAERSEEHTSELQSHLN